MHTLRKIGEIVFFIIQMIVMILVCAFGLYLTVNEATAKYKLYRYINEQIEP